MPTGTHTQTFLAGTVRECANPDCKASFIIRQGWQRFCRPYCRRRYRYLRAVTGTTALVRMFRDSPDLMAVVSEALGPDGTGVGGTIKSCDRPPAKPPTRIMRPSPLLSPPKSKPVISTKEESTHV